MKILFVIRTTDFIDPFGIAMLSGMAKSAGHETFISVMDQEDTMGVIKKLEPGIVAYSAVTGEHKSYFDFNREVKRRFDPFTIMGGAHPTYYSQCIHDGDIDAICIGEGEEAFLDVIQAVEKGQGVDHIPNIHTRKATNPIRRLVGNLDTLPFPDRDLLFSKTELGQFSLKTFMTSRGCPYPCTYCFEPVLKDMYKGLGKYTRRHSVDRAIEEINQTRAKYPLSFIKFEDDLFVLTADKWLEEFAERFPKEVGLPFNCLTRIDCVNEDTIGLLAKSGCVSTTIAVDSANPEIRKRVIKKSFKNDSVQKAFDIINRHGIKIFNNMILGLPESTIQDEKWAIDLNVECKVSYASFTILMPYPGTEISRYCEEKGYFKPEWSEFDESLWSRSPLSCFTEKEKSIQKNIFHLGALASWQPWLRKIIMNFLIYLPPNPLYTILGYLTKGYLMKKYIYQVETNYRELFKNFLKGLKLEFSRTKGFKSNDFNERLPEMGKGPMYPAISSPLPRVNFLRRMWRELERAVNRMEGI